MKPINHLTQGGRNEVENNRVEHRCGSDRGLGTARNAEKSEKNILTRCYYFALKLGTINPVVPQYMQSHCYAIILFSHYGNPLLLPLVVNEQ